MRLKRIMLDVDKAIERPSVTKISEAIESVAGVEGLVILIKEIDMETVGMEITIEGEELNYTEIVNAIEKTGAAVHSIDYLAAGKKIIEPIKRVR